MSEYNYITEQHFWKRTRPRSCWVSCFLPFKAICLLSKSRNPQPQLSQSLYLSEHGEMIWEMYAQLCPPHQEWETRAGRQGVVAWACLSNVAHPTIKVREQTLLLLAFSGNYSKTSFQLPPLPSCLIQTCPQARGTVFLKSYYEKQLFSLKICSTVSKFSMFFTFSLLLSPPGRSCHIPKCPVEDVPSFPRSLTETDYFGHC